jgi:hypothetical protein
MQFQPVMTWKHALAVTLPWSLLAVVVDVVRALSIRGVGIGGDTISLLLVVGVPVALAALHRSWKVLLAMIAMMAVFWVIAMLGLFLLFVLSPGHPG